MLMSAAPSRLKEELFMAPEAHLSGVGSLRPSECREDRSRRTDIKHHGCMLLSWRKNKCSLNDLQLPAHFHLHDVHSASPLMQVASLAAAFWLLLTFSERWFYEFSLYEVVIVSNGDHHGILLPTSRLLWSMFVEAESGLLLLLQEKVPGRILWNSGKVELGES